MKNLTVGRTLTAEEFGEAYSRRFIRTVKFLQARCSGLRPDQAEEIAQAAWARGWEYRESLRDRTLLPTWVNTIALNLFRSECRVAWRREELTYDPSCMGPSLVGLQAEQALQACSARDAHLLRARFSLGYSTDELARSAGVGRIAIRVRISRARRQIRRRAASAEAKVREKLAAAA